MADLTDIRITDPFIIRAVAQEQERRGDKTATKTAARLISERLAQLELQRPADAKKHRPAAIAH